MFKNLSDTGVFKKFTWYFSDVDSSVGLNPGFTYTKSGKYLVKLKAESPAGFNAWYTDSIQYIKTQPNALFTTNTYSGCQWVSIDFTDSSSSDTLLNPESQSWYWDFGDQSTPLTYTKTKRNKINHVYTQSGTYTVKLVYSNGICTDTFISAQKVKIIPAPRPGFVLSTKVGNSPRVGNFGLPDTLTGCAPLDINLMDKSDGTAKGWLYRIRNIHPQPPPAGDKDSATVPSFGYTFKTPGIYVIHQYLTGITGCVTEDSVYIKVNAGVSPNDKPIILRATFNAKNTIDLHWLPIAGAKKYSIFRNSGSNANLNPNALGDWIADVLDTAYTDLTPNPSPGREGNKTGAYIWLPSPGGEGPGVRYSIQATDSCANRSALSNIARPIILTGQNIKNQYFLLNWSPYEKWQNGVYNYEIEMQDPVTGNFGSINNNLPTDTLFKDGDHFTNTSLVNCYRIKATEQGGYNQISYSNTNCVPYLPAIFIPNIFSPDGNGLNDSFKIVTIGIKNYSLTVYNRWGEVVYAGSENLAGLKDPRGLGSAAWDGNFKGQPAPEGIYLYTITAHGLDQDFYQKGTISVVR